MVEWGLFIFISIHCYIQLQFLFQFKFHFDWFHLVEDQTLWEQEIANKCLNPFSLLVRSMHCVQIVHMSNVHSIQSLQSFQLFISHLPYFNMNTVIMTFATWFNRFADVRLLNRFSRFSNFVAVTVALFQGNREETSKFHPALDKREQK